MMKRENRIIGWMLVMSLMLLGCAKDGTGGENGGDQKIEIVNVRFAFSMIPQHSSHKATTRMDSAIVNPTTLGDGLEDARMLCFNGVPTANSNKIGEMIEFKNLEDELISSDTISGETTATEVSEFRQVGVPVGTTHFGFYGNAPAPSSTHEDRMKNGIIEVVGLSKSTYQGNSGVRFKPVQICKSAADFGGSTVGANLFAFLNELMSVTSTGVAPHDRWETSNDLILQEAYKRMTELKTLSSQHVSLMLATVYKVVGAVSESAPGRPLADAILTKIASVCITAPTSTSTMADLKEAYWGFPDDIHLPMGAARIAWDDTKKEFFVPDEQNYASQLDKQFSIMSMNDYCYPMNLQYQVLSDILASDTEVAMPAIEGGSSLSEQWQELIDDLYSGASTMVEKNTKSVAMKQQVNYAVGKLNLKTRIATGDVMYDATGRPVDVSNGFTLKGYIIGGQRMVDFNFQPVAGSKEYAIYDTDLNGGAQQVKRHVFTKENFVLGLGTAADKDIQIALELVNNGPEFEGADGVILHGATFYLVANLAPKEGQNYTSGSIDKVFSRDKATMVALTIEGGYPDTDGDGKPDTGLDDYGRPKPLKGLATATYGLPKLENPIPTLGLSVNLSWEDGIWFEDIEL